MTGYTILIIYFASAHTYGLHPLAVISTRIMSGSLPLHIPTDCIQASLAIRAHSFSLPLHIPTDCIYNRGRFYPDTPSLPLHIPTDCIMICGITGHRRCLCLCTYLRTASATAHIRQRRKNTLPLHIPTDCITGNRTKRASRELCLCTYLRTVSQEDDSVRKIYRFASAHTYGLHRTHTHFHSNLSIFASAHTYGLHQQR